jgi:hypothetical protein
MVLMLDEGFDGLLESAGQVVDSNSILFFSV